MERQREEGGWGEAAAAGREGEPGAPRCHFLLSRQAILASSLQRTQRNLKGHCTVGFIPGQRERSWGVGAWGSPSLCLQREKVRKPGCRLGGLHPTE